MRTLVRTIATGILWLNANPSTLVDGSDKNVSLIPPHAQKAMESIMQAKSVGRKLAYLIPGQTAAMGKDVKTVTKKAAEVTSNPFLMSAKAGKNLGEKLKTKSPFRRRRLEESDSD